MTTTADILFAHPLRAGEVLEAGARQQWGQLHGAAAALALSAVYRQQSRTLLVVVEDLHQAQILAGEIQFFSGDDAGLSLFPDWETLAYDHFSPLPEIISQRLETLYRLDQGETRILIVAVATLMQRLPPRGFLRSHAMLLESGDYLDMPDMRRRLEAAGYQCVPQVMEHGEFAVRGAILDLFPMGARLPYRIDLLDDEVDSIRAFDPETQRSLERLERIRLLPAREFPFDETGIARFRQAFRTRFDVDPARCPLYREVSASHLPGGVEYYLPLFWESTETLFDYLPADSLVVETSGVRAAALRFETQVQERYQQLSHNIERPILPPDQLFLRAEALAAQLNPRPGVFLAAESQQERRRGFKDLVNFDSADLPSVALQSGAREPTGDLLRFLKDFPGRVLFCAESAGRREMLLGTLREGGCKPRSVQGWDEFLAASVSQAICISPLQQSLLLPEAGLAIISEAQLFGEQVRQERRRKAAQRDPDLVVRNLNELHPGAPVVHEEHGVGRYLGLHTLQVAGVTTEFLLLEYAQGDKLYVPVSSLHLIGRYTGATPENAPLHRLGGDQWERIRKKAAERVRDVAVELLDIYARRAARSGFRFPDPDQDYQDFAATFPFETSPDQQQAIDQVLADMASERPMDRVVCGDVGFGKTEVAMRAAFQATQGGKQVAVLVPTTLLAQQHFDNFSDRFANWPVRVDSLSRFRTGKQAQQVLADLDAGRVDIVIGTHRLLQGDVKFKNLGLLIVDEEHRFGVRHKEQIKALRAEVDLLTMTATPIPRTLNMAMSGIRDLSIIATPPAARHPIKTFLCEWNPEMLKEACQRELKRGGQVYLLHNEVKTIEQQAAKMAQLLPEARVQVAHGQMRESQLERIMRDFYHQRFNILVCTTIIESGIDVPSANTILINRADKLGLAQIHQLRGRVGRSHHRAYAYLITPPYQQMTPDARKRLEAIAALEELGAGFTLATHDLEIRGAGELLGEEQSGQILEIGFGLYMDLLDRAVRALKSGETAALDTPASHGAEIDLRCPALIPEDYLPDIHTRLVLYKRIASAADRSALQDIQVEMIDRFGLLPEPAKTLFAQTELKLLATPLGVRKVEMGPTGGRIIFSEKPRIDAAALIALVQQQPHAYKLDGADRLRLLQELPGAPARISAVEMLLQRITPGNRPIMPAERPDRALRVVDRHLLRRGNDRVTE